MKTQEKEIKEEKKADNKPYKVYRTGYIAVSVFKNDNDYFNFVVSRSYKDDDSGEIKYTNSFNESDLVVLSAMLKKIVSELII